MTLIHRLERDQSRSGATTGVDQFTVAENAAGAAPPLLVRTSMLALADVGAFCAAAAAAYAVATNVAQWRGVPGAAVPHVPETLAGFAVLLAAIVLYLADRTHHRQCLSFRKQARLLFLASLVALLCDGCLSFFVQPGASGLFIAASWIAFPFAAVLARAAMRRVLEAMGRWRIAVVVVGTGQTSRDACRMLRSQRGLGYKVVGTVSPMSLELSRNGQGWGQVLHQFQADLLILALDAHERPHRTVIEALVRHRVPFAVVPQSDGLPVLGVEHTSFLSHDTVVLNYRNNLARPLPRCAKVAFDVGAAAAGLAVLAPVLLVLAALVKLDGGPVLFGHARRRRCARPWSIRSASGQPAF